MGLFSRRKAADHLLNVCFPFVGDSIGGSFFSALSIGRELSREEGINIVYCVREAGAVTDHLKSLNLEFDLIEWPNPFVPGVGLMKKIVSLGVAQSKIRRHISRSKIDIVHSHDLRTAVCWQLGCTRTQAAHIWHQRSILPADRISEWACNRADFIIANSSTTMASLPEEINNERLAVVDNLMPMPLPQEGLVPIAPDRRARSKRSEITSSITLGFLGAFNDQKRPHLFLEILQHLKRHCESKVSPVQIKGLIQGKEDTITTRELYTLINRFDLGQDVVIEEFTPDVERFFSKIDVLLAVAEHEAFGRTVIEAMQRQIPVIAIKSGGHSELIDDSENGFLISQDRSGEEIAEDVCLKISRLFGGLSLYQKILSGGLTTAIRFEERDRILSEILDIYSTVSSR